MGIRITATTETPTIESELHITPVMGRGMAITKLHRLHQVLELTGEQPFRAGAGAHHRPGQGQRHLRGHNLGNQRPPPLGGGTALLYYGTLGDYPQWVSAYSKNGIDTRRFPISITVGEGAVVVIDYSPEAFMTAEDVAQYCVIPYPPKLHLREGHRPFRAAL